jgi:hypothetical protein
MQGKAVFRRMLRWTPLVGVGLFLVNCSDQTGPEQQYGHLSLIPTFASRAAQIIQVDSVQVLLLRSDSATVALDTVVAIDPDSNTVVLDFTVILLAQTETFFVEMWLLDPVGEIVFHSGPDVITATAGSSTPGEGTEVVLDYVGVGSDAAGVRITSTDLVVLFGQTLTLSAEAVDSLNEIIADTPILWISTDTTRGTFPQSDVGALVGGTVRGPVNVVAELLTGQADTATVLVQPVPSSVVIVSGDAQSGDVAVALTNPIVVQVNDANDQGVQGVAVKFTTTDGGSFTPDSVVTDAQGQASTSWTLGAAPGTQTATAAVVGTAGVEATITADAIQKVATDLAIVSGDRQTGTVGLELTDSLVVLATDALGNPVGGTTVDWVVTVNNGSANPVQSVTDAAGLTATAWTLGTTVGANSVNASLPQPMASPDSASAAAAPGDSAAAGAEAPAALAVTFTATGTSSGPVLLTVESGDAQADTAGAVLPLPIVAKVVDSFGNPVQGVNVDFAVTGGGGSVSVATVPTDAAGLAQTVWSLGTTAGAQEVTATSGALQPVIFSATATHGTADQLAFRVEPTDVVATELLSPAFEVEIQDRLGNLVTNATDGVTIAIGTNPGGARASGTLTVAAIGGVATFADVSLDKAGTGYTLTASATGLVDVTSAPFNVNSGPAANLVLDGGDAQRGTVATTLAQSLTVKVTDSGGNPVSGVTVTWAVTGGAGNVAQPTTVSDALGIASNQLQVDPAFGANEVQASVTGLSGSPVAFSALGTPVGMTKLWEGLTTDWTAASNWSPTGAPTATDNIFLHAGAAAQPVLTANQSVNDLLLESGATLDVSTFTMTASGDVNAGTTIIGTGSVLLTGSGKTVTGALPNTTVSSDITVAGSTTIAGDLIVSGSGADLILNAQTVTVSGNFSTVSGGILTMTNAADVLDVAGNVTFNGGNTSGKLTSGLLQLQGDFTQTGGSSLRFAASGTHKVLFKGSVAQTITFGNPGAGSSRFQELDISNAAGVSFASTLDVLGRVTLTGTSGAVTGTTVTIAGDLVDTPGSSWQVTNTTFSGSPSTLPASMTTNVTFAGAATLVAPLTLTNNLTVSGSGADLTLNGQTVAVSGNFSTVSGGILTMTNAADVLDVAGNVTFNGGNTSTKLTSGLLRLQGDFTQTGGSSLRFAASGTHKVLFNGSVAQTITFGNPGAGSSRFQELDISNAAGVSLASTANVLGRVTLTGTSGAVTGTTVTIAGDLVDTPGSSWQVTNTTFSGSPSTLPASMTTNITFTGAATLPGGVNLTGNLTVSGSGADLILNGKTVTVSGNFSTVSSGILTMTNAADVLDVAGNVTFDGGNTSTKLTSGLLRLQGNFTQIGGSSLRFAASGTHKVQFNGTALQTISFGNPGATSSRFQDLDITNTVAAVSLSTNTQANGDLTVTGGTLSGTGTLTVVGNVTVSSTLSMTGLSVGGTLSVTGTYGVTNTTFTGTGPQSIPPLAYTNLDVTGTAAFAAATTIGGNLSVSGSSGNLAVGGQTVAVAGTFSTASSGVLTMDKALDVLDVAGDATFGGGNTNGTLTDGTLQLESNFSQTGGASLRFAASGNHTVLFDGSTAQTISFGNPGPSSSRFQHVETNNFTTNVQFISNAQINGSATFGSAKFTSTAGVTVTVDGDLIDSCGECSSGWNPTNTILTGAAAGVSGPMTTNLTITGSATLSSYTTVTGNVTVDGSGSLDLGNNFMSVDNNFSTQGTGVLKMGNTSDMLVVQGNATFGGGSATGLLTDGRIGVGGNFTQSGAATSFDATSGHTVELNGLGAQTITFANPGSGAGSSHFMHVDFWNTSAATTLSTDAFANGYIRNTSAGTATVSSLGRTLTVAALDATNITFNRVLLVWSRTTTGGFTQFSNITLNSYNVTDIALTINHPGQLSSATIAFGGIWNANWDPSGGGAYIKAEDVVADLNQLVISGFMFVPDLSCVGDFQTLGFDGGADLSLFGCS